MHYKDQANAADEGAGALLEPAPLEEADHGEHEPDDRGGPHAPEAERGYKECGHGIVARDEVLRLVDDVEAVLAVAVLPAPGQSCRWYWRWRWAI